MVGGTLVAKTDVIVFGGSQDGYIRAVGMKTGKELWTQKMPNGASGIYDKFNGYLLAYALPE